MRKKSIPARAPVYKLYEALNHWRDQHERFVRRGQHIAAREAAKRAAGIAATLRKIEAS